MTMSIEELEAEVVRLRAELDVADRVTTELRDKEQNLTRRNVALFERLRYIEHSIKQIRDQFVAMLQGAVE